MSNLWKNHSSKSNLANELVDPIKKKMVWTTRSQIVMYKFSSLSQEGLEQRDKIIIFG